jgi:putative redox protein
MKHTVTCNWLENLAFETEVTGHRIVLDAKDDVGGEDRGPRPKPLLLSALAGCTGMDVIYMLKRMRIEPGYFNMTVDGEMNDEPSKAYRSIHLVYEFKESDGLDTEKVERAVRMSQEKYCGVSELLRKACELTYEIRYL